MIIGVFLRNYKCYNNLNFIPFTTKECEKLSIFIGGNGVGKSSVLESIDCCMNNVDPKNWETSIGKKKSEAVICPVFLIKKELASINEKIEHISNVFWNNDFDGIDYPAFNSFLSFREEIRGKYNPEEYYLISIGKNYAGKILLTSTSHNKIFNTVKRLGVSTADISSIFNDILGYYNFVYIPVENKVSDVLSIQADEMQGLMDKSIVKEIQDILSSKEHSERESSKKQSSIMDLINGKLNDYIANINSELSEGYKFDTKGAIKKTIKPSDIVHRILSLYFRIRPLTKDGKSIESLSSGQQRLALIDVATTLLSTDSEKNKEVILAIDEPESSLESRIRFEQFNNLVKISEKFNRQIIITTHWYGLLLRPTNGALNYVSEGSLSPRIDQYSLLNLFDNRRRFPDSMEMKSYFDLIGSIISFLKKNSIIWLVCEGITDSLYIQSHLQEKLENVYVLPFNGSGNIKRLFGLMTLPFSDPLEREDIKGKVVLLVDTDEKSPIVVEGYKAKDYDKKLIFNRILLDRDKNEGKLVSVAERDSRNTVIEDVMSARIMYEAVVSIAQEDEVTAQYLNGFIFNESAEYADFSKGLKFLEATDFDSFRKTNDFREYLQERKMKRWLCSEYTRIALSNNVNEMDWMKKLVDYIED